MQSRILTLFFVISVSITLTICSFPGYSEVIELTAPGQPVLTGSSFNVDASISGLGNFMPNSLSIFDLNISYDPSLISFNSAAFGDQLDLLELGSISSSNVASQGVINLFELSIDNPADLDTLQPGAFSLATLSFNAVDIGTSPLEITVLELGDAIGDPITASLRNTSVSVIVPESSTMPYALVCIGFIAIVGIYNHNKAKRITVQSGSIDDPNAISLNQENGSIRSKTLQNESEKIFETEG